MDWANPVDLPIEPVIGTLRVADGVRLEDAAPCATTLTPPPRAARGREGERLFILLDLTGPASPGLHYELGRVVAQAYWSTAGSSTAALREAAAAANRHLLRVNLQSDAHKRCQGGLTCAALRDSDLFILQAGPARACALRREHLICFRRDEKPRSLGTGPLADVRLSHTFAATGDTLLLASPALIREAGYEAIARALLRAEVRDVLEALEGVGAQSDFTALVVRWTPPAGPSAAREADQPSRPSRRAAVKRRRSARPKPARPAGPNLRERMGKMIRRVGRGVAAAAAWPVRALGALFRRMLPGPGRQINPRARPRRPTPKENRTVMMVIAICIPVVLAVVVAAAYLQFGDEARFRSVIKHAEEEIALAQAAGGTSEESRPHWEAAREHATSATTLQPGDPDAIALQGEAQAALDLLDGIVRLTPVELWEFGPGTARRQLVIHGQMIFVLDPAGGWAYQLTLNATGDGVVEEEAAPPLVKTGQQIAEGQVGDLVDLAWVAAGAERQTAGLLMLERGGLLVGYNPGSAGEGEAPKFTRISLVTPPAGTPIAVDSFEDRFYVLDIVADQIWRYHPRGDAYPEPPEGYFASSPPKPLATASDMAIDGSIYVLYSDGTILKFGGGEPQPFDVRGLPGDFSQAVALAVDPASGGGVVYVADQGNKRVIVLEPDGDFQAQFLAEPAFNELEALAVDEAAKRLYAVSGGRLYLASLP